MNRVIEPVASKHTVQDIQYSMFKGTLWSSKKIHEYIEKSKSTNNDKYVDKYENTWIHLYFYSFKNYLCIITHDI